MATISRETDLDKLVVQVKKLNLDAQGSSGAYGVVYRVTVEGRECIAKKLHSILLKVGDYYPVDQRDSIIEKFRNECRILSGLDHPNVIAFVGVHYGRDKNDISLIMERLQWDVADFIEKNPGTSLVTRINILYDVSKGLQYLHSLTPPLIHRDLTAPNILLTDDLTAKIGDLGVSRYVDPTAMSQTLTQAPGNVYYMSPEARDENPQYTVKLDIFSFGALIIHTFIGKVPDVHDVPYDQTAVQLSQEGKIELTRRKKAIQQMTTDHCMYPLIVRCLHDKPASRPTTDELCGSLVDLIQKNDAAVQKTEIQATLKQQFRKGDVWFLVDIRWIKQWMKFIGYKPDDQSSVGKKSANPGPLDNSNLSNTHGHLRERLVDEMDYFLIPESAWNKLASWYGLSPSSKVISRRVIEYGLCEKHLKVEVYLLEFQLCAQPYLNDVKTREFSRADTVSDLESAIREEFGIPLTRECRVWHRYMANTYELLSKADQSLHDAGLYNEETVMLEKKNDDGSWPYRNTVPCGLSNPGNTSFMNSVLQCLSNTVSLTNYFLADYKKHINTTSTLGTGGAIAEAYAALIEELWCGKGSVFAPKHFLVQLRRYASQLTDLVEHDANELLAILLDSLHEDLNLVKTKLSIDMTVPTKGREEQDIAEEWWHKHLQRNQSMIVKLFQGQLRTTLECSKCKQTSKTFDPFTTLSLQLPPFKGTRNIYVCLVRSNPFQSVMKYKLKLLKNGRLWDLKTKLGSLCDIEASHLAVTDVYNGRFHRTYADKDPLSHIVDTDDIYCYQLQKEHIGNRKMVHVPVYMRAETFV